jgi:hypothetical protein
MGVNWSGRRFHNLCGGLAVQLKQHASYSTAGALHTLQAISIWLLLVQQDTDDGNWWMHVHHISTHIPIHRTGCQGTD